MGACVARGREEAGGESGAPSEWSQNECVCVGHVWRIENGDETLPGDLCFFSPQLALRQGIFCSPAIGDDRRSPSFWRFYMTYEAAGFFSVCLLLANICCREGGKGGGVFGCEARKGEEKENARITLGVHTAPWRTLGGIVVWFVVFVVAVVVLKGGGVSVGAVGWEGGGGFKAPPATQVLPRSLPECRQKESRNPDYILQKE